MVPGLSASSSSSIPTPTSMTPLWQEIDHSKSSSSSSTSTPMTSSTEIDHADHPPAIVSSESVDRQVSGDPYSSETSEELLNKPTEIPKPKKNENHEQVRGDAHCSDILEWLQEFRENLVDDRVPEHRDSHASSSHELSLDPYEKCGFWVNTVFIFTSLNTEIARSARGPKSQVPIAEDALAESNFVQKILVV